jgi:hypothetical protein
LQRLTKGAIDQAYSRYVPDYLLIVGATDVVVMQELANPANGDEDPDNDDGNTVVPGDLLRATRAYSTDAAVFLSPVRVVGRLPDIVGRQSRLSSN